MRNCVLCAGRWTLSGSSWGMIENFGWLIEGQLAGSGGLIHHEELVWLLPS
jgi:hypothetical protein